MRVLGSRTGSAFVASLVVVLGAFASPASGAGAHRLPGPPLDVEPIKLESALSCPEGLTHPNKPVVLLVHGTATTATESWPWGFGLVLPKAGFDWCMVQLPDREMIDIQVSSQYVVQAVRTLYAKTRHKVDLIGHSQGGLQVRWAVRWWPDVRAHVNDVVTLAGSNRGVATANAACNPDCAPAIWQQRQRSALTTALNRVWTPSGPSYTAIYSLTDELIQPAAPVAAGSVEGARNILVQELCPGRYVGHIQAIDDAVYVSMALDAIEHPGPADPARFDPSLCLQSTYPGIDPLVAHVAEGTLYANALATFATYPHVAAEPPLRPYAQSG